MDNSAQGTKILYITRPIIPPWDEASKNIALVLSKNIQMNSIYLLTGKKNNFFQTKAIQKNIYTNSQFNYYQKFLLLRYLFSHYKEFNIIHSFFLPLKKTSIVLQYLKKRHSKKNIQSLPCLPDSFRGNKKLLKLLLYGDLIITYSDFTKNTLHGLGYDNVMRIYPPVDTDIFSPQISAVRLKEKYNFGSAPIILFPGEYSLLSHTNNLLSIVSVVVRRIPKIKFVFACRKRNKDDAAIEKKIKAELEKQGLMGNVVFFETHPDIHELIYACDICIYPVNRMDRKFDLPLTLIESLSCAKPIIFHAIRALREFTQFKAGIGVDMGDTNGFSDAIARLIEDKSEYNHFAENARRAALEHFDSKIIAKQYEKIYNHFFYA